MELGFVAVSVTNPSFRVPYGCGCLRLNIQQHGRFLKDGGNIRHETRREVTVHHAMIERTAQRGDSTRDHLTINHPWLLLNRAESNNRHLTGVNNRGARVNAE